MQSVMKAILMILIATEVILLLTAISPTFVDSREMEKAFVERSKQPTPENRAKVDEWNAKVKKTRLVSNVIVWSLVGINTLATVIVSRKIRTACNK